MYRAVALKRPRSQILFKQLNLRLEYQYHRHFKNAIQYKQVNHRNKFKNQFLKNNFF